MLTVTNEDVLPAYLQRVSDFEDCLLATCTKANQCDAIVTRNKKDFLSFWITLLSPEELLNIYSYNMFLQSVAEGKLNDNSDPAYWKI